MLKRNSWNRVAGLALAAAILSSGGCKDKYTVGGTVSGLSGPGLVLENNSADGLTIDQNGAFVFSTRVANDEAYSVTVETQPSDPAQTCTVQNGSGAIDKADVTHVIVVCTQAGRYAYAANQLSNNISGFTIDSSTGYLTPMNASPFAATGSAPVAVATDPDRQFLYVADFSSNGVSVFSINSTTGALSPIGSQVATGGGPVAVYAEPSASYLYVANEADGTVSAYSINRSSGLLSALTGSPYAVGRAPSALTSDPGGNYLYVANSGDGTVSVLAIAPTDGTLSSVAGSPFAAEAGPISVAVDPAGDYAYVANATADSISAYAINASSGVLSPVTGSPFTTGSSPESVVVGVGLSVSVVYAAHVTSANDVAAYSIDPSTGALSLLGSSVPAGSSPMFMTIDPAGTFAYVANSASNDVSVYSIDPGTGELTLVSGAPFATGSEPRSIAID